MTMNQIVIKTILRWVEVAIHIAVPITALVIIILNTISPSTFSPDILLQVLLVLVAGIAVSESILRFGTLNEIKEKAEELSEISNLQLLQSARESGVVDLSLRANPLWLQDVANEIANCGAILDLCGVGLPKFRDDEFLRTALIVVGTKYDIRVLLLDPDSDEANRRGRNRKAAWKENS